MGRDEPLFRPEFAAVGGEDTDLFIRAYRAGFRYAVSPDSIIVRVWDAERLTLRGMLRRAFKIGHTRIMLAQRHDPPDKVRKMSKRAVRDGLRAVGALPRRLRHAGSLGQSLTQIAFSAGQVYAARGGRYAYYRLV
jgi:GT2 family glycosyltransferase